MYLPFKFIQNFKCLLPIIFKVSKGRIVVEYVRTKICYIVTCSWYKFLDDECTFKYLFFKIKINQAMNIHH